MHKDTQVQGTELGQEGREGSFALAGFPTDQARATLEPDGPKMLNRWDGSFQCVGKPMVGTMWEGMRFILNWDNPSSLECSLAGAPGQLTCPILYSGITTTHTLHDILVPLFVWDRELRGLPFSHIH